MVDRFVGRKLTANDSVKFDLVGVQAAFVVYVLAHDLGDRGCIGSRDMKRTNLAAALD